MLEQDPTRQESAELVLLTKMQQVITRPATLKAARGLSYLGEHSAGWLALGVLGAAVDAGRRKSWLKAAAGVLGAHAASVVVKRVVGRTRPEHPDLTVGVATPSELSFPSAHATSTTAAAVLYSGLLRRNVVPAVVPPMLVSRLVLGVHYPSDVLAGAALGGVLGGVLRRRLNQAERATG